MIPFIKNYKFLLYKQINPLFTNPFLELLPYALQFIGVPLFFTEHTLFKGMEG